MARRRCAQRLWATAGAGLVLAAGCWQEFDSSLKQSADSLSTRDAVTGVRTVNFVSEAEETKQGEGICKSILDDCAKKNVAVDKDAALVARLQEMMQRIGKVSHRPNMPWEIHLLNVAEDNAYTVGGGKVFIYRGLIGGLAQDDDELAVIIAHEAAHVTCRHISKSMTWSMLGPVVSNRTKSPIFSGSFSTQHEDEADRVGLLYAALAGYDPASAVRIWKRADTKYGSSPGDYAYDHELSRVRAEKVAALVPTAQKYYVAGKINPDYEKLRTNNDITPKIKNTGNQKESGLGAVLEAGVAAHSQYAQTRAEQDRREAARKIALASIAVSGVTATPQGANMTVGFMLSNGGASEAKVVTVRVTLLGATGIALHTLDCAAGPVPAKQSCSFSMQAPNVAGTQTVTVKVIEVQNGN